MYHKNCRLRPPLPFEFIKYLRIRYAFIILDVRAVSYTCPLLLQQNFLTRKHTSNHFNSQVIREFWQAFLSSSQAARGWYFPQLPRRSCGQMLLRSVTKSLKMLQAEEGKEQNTHFSPWIKRLPTTTSKHFNDSPQLTDTEPKGSYTTFERREIWIFFSMLSISRSFGPTNGLFGPLTWPIWSNPR